MSYWVSLCDEHGNILSVPSHSEGGTMVMGGTTEATLNITYNYGGQFAKVGLDFHEGDPFGRNGHTAVHGKIAADLIPQLRDAVEALRMEHDTDYWKPTPGNAGYALSVLLGWAQLHPDGIFRVS